MARDKGLDMGTIRYFDDTQRLQRGQGRNFFGFRKMFRDYFGKLNVPFYDSCCPELTGDLFPVRYNETTDTVERYNGTTWIEVEIATTALPLTITVDTINESTANAGVTIETVKLENGGVTNTAETMIVPFYPTTAAQSLSGAGAVNVTSFLTQFTSTGAGDALTIASGTQIGQRKKVSHVVDGGSGVLTGVFVGGTTITFTTVGEFCELIWTGVSWGVLELGNSATPGTPPTLA